MVEYDRCVGILGVERAGVGLESVGARAWFQINGEFNRIVLLFLFLKSTLLRAPSAINYHILIHFIKRVRGSCELADSLRIMLMNVGFKGLATLRTR